ILEIILCHYSLLQSRVLCPEVDVFVINLQKTVLCYWWSANVATCVAEKLGFRSKMRHVHHPRPTVLLIEQGATALLSEFVHQKPAFVRFTKEADQGKAPHSHQRRGVKSNAYRLLCTRSKTHARSKQVNMGVEVEMPP